MKNILIFLLLLTSYVAANTCTEAYFKTKGFDYYPVEGDPQIDSVYEKVNLGKDHNYENVGKYYYRNKIIERFVTIYIGDVVDTTAYNFYRSLDEKVLSKKGAKFFFPILLIKTLCFLLKNNIKMVYLVWT